MCLGCVHTWTLGADVNLNGVRHWSFSRWWRWCFSSVGDWDENREEEEDEGESYVPLCSSGQQRHDISCFQTRTEVQRTSQVALMTVNKKLCFPQRELSPCRASCCSTQTPQDVLEMFPLVWTRLTLTNSRCVRHLWAEMSENKQLFIIEFICWCQSSWLKKECRFQASPIKSKESFKSIKPLSNSESYSAASCSVLMFLFFLER